ncbi:MAG: hypothetical protein J6U84_05090 [Bacteroidales bacterium]|nr:hypothetical protein [Bacteroidales bacterium]
MGLGQRKKNFMYITKANFRRIIHEIETPEDFKLDDIILWLSPNGSDFYSEDESCLFSKMFSKKEKTDILVFKACCKGDYELFKNFYKKIEEPDDSFTYVESEKSPSYHRDNNCIAMKSDFKGILIPQEIHEQKKEEEFRQYWYDNTKLREEKPDIFLKRINEKFSLKVSIKSNEIVSRPNSGVHIVCDNRSILEINNNISRVFKELITYIEEDRDKRLYICMNFGYLSWLGDKKSEINTVLPSWCTQEEVKDILSKLHFYKKTIKRELENLYIRKYIPDLNLEDSLLKSLGFKPCYVCCK